MTLSVSTNANALAVELGKVSGQSVPILRAVVERSAISVREQWRSSARRSAGIHGKHYPKAIEYKMTGVLEATVMPDESMPQGGMSFEFGSKNQAPHLDGQRAIDVYRPIIEARILAAMGRIL